MPVSQPKNVAIVVVTGDRGLCGGYNAQMIKKAEARVIELKDQVPNHTWVGRQRCGDVGWTAQVVAGGWREGAVRECRHRDTGERKPPRERIRESGWVLGAARSMSRLLAMPSTHS